MWIRVSFSSFSIPTFCDMLVTWCDLWCLLMRGLMPIIGYPWLIFSPEAWYMLPLCIAVELYLHADVCTYYCHALIITRLESIIPSLSCTHVCFMMKLFYLFKDAIKIMLAAFVLCGFNKRQCYSVRLAWKKDWLCHRVQAGVELFWGMSPQ